MSHAGGSAPPVVLCEVGRSTVEAAQWRCAHEVEHRRSHMKLHVKEEALTRSILMIESVPEEELRYVQWERGTLCGSAQAT